MRMRVWGCVWRQTLDLILKYLPGCSSKHNCCKQQWVWPAQHVSSCMVASVNRTALLESVLFLVLGHPRILQLLPLALKALLWPLLVSTSGISYFSPMMEWPSNADNTWGPWILVLSHLEAEGIWAITAVWGWKGGGSRAWAAWNHMAVKNYGFNFLWFSGQVVTVPQLFRNEKELQSLQIPLQSLVVLLTQSQWTEASWETRLQWGDQ